MKLSKKDRVTLERILSSLLRGQKFLMSNDTLVCKKKDQKTTSLDFINDQKEVCVSIDKEIGSELALLHTGISNLAKMLSMQEPGPTEEKFNMKKVALRIKKVGDEYQVVPVENGKSNEENTYYTDDKQDAIDTRKAKAKEYQRDGWEVVGSKSEDDDDDTSEESKIAKVIDKLLEGNPDISEYDKKFDAWMSKVTKLLGLSSIPDAMKKTDKSDPYGSYDSGMTPEEFVTEVKG